MALFQILLSFKVSKKYNLEAHVKINKFDPNSIAKDRKSS